MNQFMTDQRVRPGAVAAHLRRQLLLQPVRRPDGRAEPVEANTLEWTDAVAAAARQLRDDPDGLPRGRTSTACRAWPTTTCRRPSPGPPRPARSTRSWPDDVPVPCPDRPLGECSSLPCPRRRMPNSRSPEPPPRGPHCGGRRGRRLHLAPDLRRGPGDDLPGRHGGARLADDVRHEHVPLPILGRRLGRLHRARAPALRGGRGAGHADPGGLVRRGRSARVDEGPRRASRCWR